MKNFTRLFSVSFLTIISVATIQAQDGVLIDYLGITRDASAVLDVRSASQGVLVPRFDIIDLSTAAPVTAPATGLLVYNTYALSGVGYYYWNGTRWTRFVDNSTGSNFVTGTGTQNYVTKWNNATGTTIGNSLIFDNGTNVGIGEAIPGYKLDVNGDIRTAGNIYITNSSGTGTNPFRIDGFSNALYVIAESGAGGAATQVKFRTASGASTAVDRMTIDGNGDVTINSLASGMVKATSGVLSIAAGSDLPSGSLNYIQNQNSVDQIANFRIKGSGMINGGLTNSSTRPAIAAGTMANGELRAFSNSGPGSDDGFLRISAGGGTTAGVKSYIDLSGYANAVPDMFQNIAFGTSGTERMRIKSDGNIGIGNIDPDALLTVGSATHTNSYVRLYRTTKPHLQIFEGSTSTARLQGTVVLTHPQFQVANSTGATSWFNVNHDDGSVGVGTTAPTQLVHLQKSGSDNYLKIDAGSTSANYSGLMLSEHNINYGFTLRHSAANDNLFISHQDNTPTFTDLVTFEPGGNVGIGTPTPDMKLDVASGGAILGGQIYVSPTNNNTLNSGYATGADNSDIWINYRGYDDAQSYFRDFRVGNGKGTQIAMFDGSSGSMAIGLTAATNKLDIANATRTGTHATGSALYVTGTFNASSNGVEFRHDNGTQGIGFGYNTIYATGSTANQDLNLLPKGSGNINIGNSTTNLDPYILPAAGVYLRVGSSGSPVQDVNTNYAYIKIRASIGTNGNGSSAPLYVNGTSITTPNLARGYFNNGTGGSVQQNTSPSGTIQVEAAGYYWANGGGYIATSDARIKNIIRLSSSKNDLEAVAQIEITDYTYIDQVQNGVTEQKKVIAQQLQSVFPNAITKLEGIIPNVYETAKSVTASGNSTQIVTGKLHSFVSGDVVKLILESGSEKLLAVSVLDDHTFAVAEEINGNIFVYGKKVDDLLTVDYDALTTLNISATQELLKTTRHQQLEIEALKADNQALRNQSQTSTENYNCLKAEVETLKQMMTIYGKN